MIESVQALVVDPVAIACVGAMGLLVFGMGVVISSLRGLRRQFYGHPVDPTDLLYKVVRAHANTTEYAAFLAVLMLYLGAGHPAPWVRWTMVAVTVCRYLFVIGFITSATVARPNPLRFVGAMGTYFGGLALCAAAIQVG